MVMELNDIIQRMKNPEENFPLLLTGGFKPTEARAGRYIEHLKTSANYLEEGAIPNARFKEQNSYLASMAEDSFKRNVSNPHFYGRSDEPELKKFVELMWSINVYGMASIGSSMKKLTKFLKDNPDQVDLPGVDAMIRVFAELNVLVQAVDHLKGMSQKRVMKSDAEREADSKYIPPMADKNAEQMVHKALLALTNEMYQELIDERIKDITDTVTRAIEKSQAGGLGWRDFAPYENAMLSRCAVRENNRSSKYTWGPETEETIKDLGTREATDIRDQFVIKNLRKLASVIDRKGALDTISTVGREVNMSGLKGTLEMKFVDGTSFRVTNSVVQSYSVLGKPFHRFPLRFHDVTKPDGSKKAAPSEEWMNNSF